MLNSTFLNHLAKHSPQDAIGLLSAEGLGADSLCRLLPELDRERPYSRHVLGVSEQCEVMLARWNAGQECAPHDHGLSGGFVLFLKGDFEETHFAYTNGQFVAARKRGLKAGDISRIEPGEIHSCRAFDEGVSLHVYTPPIYGMKVFDRVQNEILIVDSSAGAWLPQEAHLVISKQILVSQ